MAYRNALIGVGGGLGIALLGTVLSAIHVVHIFKEEGTIPLLIGGIIPLLLSIALVIFGLWITRADWDVDSTLRVGAWLALGMGWMMIAGSGAIIYETVEGTTLSHTWFLLAIFATYGAIPGLVTGLYDTQRNQRARILRTQERAIESASDGMAILDANQEYVYVNDAHAEIYGYEDPETLLGKSWRVLYDAEETERFESEIMPVLLSEGSWRGRATGCRTDGTTFPQRVTLTKLDGDGFVCIVRDISDTVDRELAFSVLNRVLRHNLSNEITVVIGQAQRIRETSTGEVATAAALIEETGQTLVELGRKERQIAELVLRDPSVQALSLASLLEPAVKQVAGRFPEATIEVTGDMDVTVLAIPEVEQAFIELIENGIAHNDDPAPWVGVEIRRTDAAVAIDICDEGPGIPIQDRKVVTGQREIGALFHGSGLGLWFVYWVMRDIGGSVTFADRDPTGSIVRLSLSLP